MDIDTLIRKLKKAKEESPQHGLAEVIIMVGEDGDVPVNVVNVSMDKSDEELAVLCNGSYCAIETGSI